MWEPAPTGDRFSQLASHCYFSARSRTLELNGSPVETLELVNHARGVGDDDDGQCAGNDMSPGRFRERIGPASQIAERLMTPILEDLPFASGDGVLAFVNGMGGTPLIELYIVYAEVAGSTSTYYLFESAAEAFTS